MCSYALGCCRIPSNLATKLHLVARLSAKLHLAGVKLLTARVTQLGEVQLRANVRYQVQLGSEVGGEWERTATLRGGFDPGGRG